MIFLSIIFLFPTIFLAHEITNKFSFLLCVYHSNGISKFFLTFFLRWCAMCVCVCVLVYSRFPMHHRSSIPVELRKWECVPMCASTDRQRAKEEKIVAVFLFLFFFIREFFSVCREKKKSEDKQWMRTSISNANMCQPGADYVCDWKPLDNALHASSFPHLVFYIIYIYIYMWRREDELARITGKWMQWDLLGGTCCWPDSVYTHFFFSLSFFCRMRIEFLSISPFFLSWLVTTFPCRPRSNYRNGPTSLLSPLFFFLLARSPRALSFLVSVASSSSFAFFFFTILSFAPIHPF